MSTPNGPRSCHASPTAPATPTTPISSKDRMRRVKAITELETDLAALELPALGYSTVSDHCAIHVLSTNSLAVVVLCGHNAGIIEQVIRSRYAEQANISRTDDIITVTIESDRPLHRARRRTK